MLARSKGGGAAKRCRCSAAPAAACTRLRRSERLCREETHDADRPCAQHGHCGPCSRSKPQARASAASAMCRPLLRSAVARAGRRSDARQAAALAVRIESARFHSPVVTPPRRQAWMPTESGSQSAASSYVSDGGILRHQQQTGAIGTATQTSHSCFTCRVDSATALLVLSRVQRKLAGLPCSAATAAAHVAFSCEGALAAAARLCTHWTGWSMYRARLPWTGGVAWKRRPGSCARSSGGWGRDDEAPAAAWYQLSCDSQGRRVLRFRCRQHSSC